MHIQKKKNRRFLDITSLHNQQPYCHTESHHFVSQSHDCLKMQSFYSFCTAGTIKKAWFQSPSKIATVFVQSFIIFTRFHSSFLLIIAVISSKRPTNKKRIILGFASRLAALKQPSVPQNWSQMDDRSWWKKI